MNSVHFPSDTGEHAIVLTRVAETHWHALEDDRVVGRGETSRRSDGRIFLSIDSWHDAVFDRLAEAMLADLPRPLHTVVDEADTDLRANWVRAGFTTRRREWEYLVPTDPSVTGLGSAPLPSGVTIVPAGDAVLTELSTVDREIREEVGWADLPAEVVLRPDGITAADLPKYVVAATPGGYAGFARVVRVTRLPRIGLVAVKAAQRRRGIARALLAHALGSLHRSGIGTAAAEVHEANAAATALFEGIGARRASSNLELVIR
ncbi:GNAT family N-acetyltransferase [Amycolatopsis sp. CA-230715]|uniref:GNAT family N-acetyltransferase n=1 Tax=Amycolatopsis sp. CA-230715 TaxID=2745196 RepID=UPI001C00D941|nr:GNAT family N-acetyltransferase [Amycolatopsis sp. CA-230715]QWF83297.1 hypothetical protein HUW46_06737 [Amycolatopsis sp. CA-230715]